MVFFFPTSREGYKFPRSHLYRIQVFSLFTCLFYGFVSPFPWLFLSKAANGSMVSQEVSKRKHLTKHLVYIHKEAISLRTTYNLNQCNFLVLFCAVWKHYTQKTQEKKLPLPMFFLINAHYVSAVPVSLVPIFASTSLTTYALFFVSICL